MTIDLYRSDSAGGATPAEPAPISLPLFGLRVLLAEDDPLNAMVVRLILTRNGASVHHVPNGVQAVRLAAEVHFDCAVFDVRMPHLTGPQAAAVIRRNPAAPDDLPIIALTANNSPADRDHCLAAGMDVFLTKPVCETSLIEAIVQLCAATAHRSSGSGRGADRSNTG
ncbi:response regulator [Hyphomonadaceae bacterium BL14]|nr:response regulator [Hyphomonadaceae bacterium BL14]